MGREEGGKEEERAGKREGGKGGRKEAGRQEGGREGRKEGGGREAGRKGKGKIRCPCYSQTTSLELEQSRGMLGRGFLAPPALSPASALN